MASLSTDGAGNRTIQFVAADGKRRSVRLGKVNKKLAESVKLRVEALAAALAARLPLDTETAGWTAGLGNDLHAKLAAVGLLAPRQSETLGPFLRGYLADRRAASKPATVVTLAIVVNDLLAHFGAGTPLRDVTPAWAEGFKRHYLTRTPKLAPATAARRLKAARMFFDHARRAGLVAANPFADVTTPGGVDERRKHYVSPADADKLIAAANPTWRVIIALARFAGLRCPSEVLSLKWADVNFEKDRMTVPVPKLEHLPGKGYRVVPIFAALRPHLEEAFELAADGAVYVVPGGHRDAALKPGGWNSVNLRTQFGKLIRRAGLQAWPRLFHNLRASCETDLMQHHPIHVVTAWLGNTPKIALAHYLQTLDRDFEKAVRGGAETGAVSAELVRNPVQSGAAASRQDRPPVAASAGGWAVKSDAVLSGLLQTDCEGGQGGTRTHTPCGARF